MSSSFPGALDSDEELPFVNDNIVELGATAINAVRDAVINIEQYLGIGADGSVTTVANRLGVSLAADGTIKSSALTSLGLVTLPITNGQIASNAGIPESKLILDHRTQDLYNYITNLTSNLNSGLGWISISGSKLEPHLAGSQYRHTLSHIDVNADTSLYFKNKFRTFRDNTNAFTSINGINDEFLAHQFADGSAFVTPSLIITNNGSTYPATHAHVSSGIFLNTSTFSTIPQTATDLQQFAEYVDSSSILLLGTRIQNLYSNGISKASRSSSLITDGYGQSIIPATTAITYLLNTGVDSAPVDNINTGDDIIEFKPSASDISTNSFDAKFALIKIGDIVRVNYGGVEVQFIIKEKKYIQGGGSKKYIIRINGKNLKYTTSAVARVDKPLFNINKYGALAIAAANNSFSATPSLIVGSPRGAMALGVGFNPDLFDGYHYNLYLGLYQTGNPLDGYNILPAIDVTGDKGANPGKYTLDSIIESTNNAFRQTGYNYRFIAFQYQGQFGIALADSYNNASFSIFDAVVGSDGYYDSVGSDINFKNNVIDVFSEFATDPLGFGPNGANIASPPFMTSYGSAEASQLPTKLFVPLKRNNYYVNGVEKEKFNLESGQTLDGYGDGYWIAEVLSQSIFPGASPVGRVQTTYRIPLDLSTTNIAIGKTIVIQSYGSGSTVDFGRFIIQSIGLGCAPTAYAELTVYDAVHGTAVSPSTTLSVGSFVKLYFNSDSVSFNKESSTDFTNLSPFKRHFEILTDQNGITFTHERARINISGSTMVVDASALLYSYSELSKINIVKVSPKLRGYQFGAITKITMHITAMDAAAAEFSGYLSSYNGTTYSKKGKIVSGRLGQITRFYDETNVDFIDIIFDINTAISVFTNKDIDFQLFPTLSLDDEVMLIGTCQLNDSTFQVNHIRDERQFGNTSEKDLSTSALNLISLGDKILHGNGVINGFDLGDISPNPFTNHIYLNGGSALINGKVIQMNNEGITIPLIKEASIYNINWALCVNDKSEYQSIPLLDFDSVLVTPSNRDRLFTAYNPLNGSSYNLDSSTFSDIINNRKDLAILYIVSSEVTAPSTISLSVKDARKYVNDGDTNLPLKLTTANSQGNFKNASSIFSWIIYNNSFNSTAIVKGADASNATITTALDLNFSSAVTIDGENNATLTFTFPITIGSNITFKNLSIIFNGGVSFSSTPENVTFENCIVTVNNLLNIAPANNIVFDINSGSNINIINSTFNVTYTALQGSGAVFRVISTPKFSVDNSTISVTFDSPASGGYVPGDLFIIKNSAFVSITNSTFSGNFNQFLRNSSSNNILLKNLTVTSSYNPMTDGPIEYNVTSDPIGIADGLPTITYSASNLVNSGRGYIYSNVTSTLDNFIIDNVTFNYEPVSVSGNRFSFINFELTTNSSILRNLSIINCNFNNVVSGDPLEDLKPAISIINRAPATTSVQQNPILSNVNIENNYCNRNQSIILTSETDVDGYMIYPGLVAQNCTIRENTCGTIGYWTAASAKVSSISMVNSTSDKDSGLIIEGNICHLINNVNHTGNYYVVSKLLSSVTDNTSAYPSGSVVIKNNKCNWIHTGIAFEENSSLQITNNSLCAYDPAYLAFYGDSPTTDTTNGTYKSSGFAIFVSANKHNLSPAVAPGDGNDSSCLIVGNTTSTGYWLQPTSTAVTYKYVNGYIYCQSSNIITNNILKGVDDNSSFGDLVMVSGLTNIVTNNQIYRNGKYIHRYILFGNVEVPTWNGAGASAIITDNYLDSPFTSDIDLSENLIYLTTLSRAVCERNKNQTGYVSVPMTSGIYGTNLGAATQAFGTLGTSVLQTYLSCAPSIGNTFGDGYKSYVLRAHDQGTVGNRFWAWQDDLGKYLPTNVRLLKLKMGIKGFGSTSVTTLATSPAYDSNINLYLNKYAASVDYVNLDYFTNIGTSESPPHSVGVADSNIVNDATAPFATVTGGQINSTYSTLFMNIDLTSSDASGSSSGAGPFSDISDTLVVGQGYGLGATLEIRFQRVNIVDLYFSPLLVKYRW